MINQRSQGHAVNWQARLLDGGARLAPAKLDSIQVGPRDGNGGECRWPGAHLNVVCMQKSALARAS